VSVAELIEKLKELGFQLVSQDNDYLWVLRKEFGDYVAQMSIIRSKA